MRILELQEYAKKHGFDSVEFKFTNLSGEEVKGKWLDAYFGLFTLTGAPENEFISVNSWRNQLGDEAFEFEII